jgi:hypothetical protein
MPGTQGEGDYPPGSAIYDVGGAAEPPAKKAKPAAAVVPLAKRVRVAWSVKEEEELCRSYVHNSVNPVVGNDQKQEQFWGNFFAEFKVRMQDELEPSRTVEKCRNHYRDIAKAVNKWVPIANKMATEEPPSGVSDVEEYWHGVYNLKQNQAADGPRAFKHSHCFKNLKDLANFQMMPPRTRVVDVTVDAQADPPVDGDVAKESDEEDRTSNTGVVGAGSVSGSVSGSSSGLTSASTRPTRSAAHDARPCCTGLQAAQQKSKPGQGALAPHR